MKETEINLLSLVVAILENKKRYFFHFLVISTLAIGFSLLLPKYYKATAVFLPPDVGSGLGFAAFLPNFSNADLLGTNEITKRQVMTLIESREIKEAIINYFDLTHVYKTYRRKDRLDVALKLLEENTSVAMNEEGGLGFADVISFSLTIVDKDSVRCAKMANYYVKCIDDKMRQLNMQKPSSERHFFDKQLAANMAELEKSRSALQAFQQENKIFDIPEQVKYVLQSSSELRAQAINLETKRNYLALQKSTHDASVQQLDGQISILENKILEIEKQQKPDLFLGLNRSLGLAYRYADLFMDVEIRTGLQALIKRQLEQAKIQEAKDMANIKIVDHARTPQKKFKPKRLIIVLIIVGIYMFLLLVYTLWLRRYGDAQYRSEGLSQTLEIIRGHFSLK